MVVTVSHSSVILELVPEVSEELEVESKVRVADVLEDSSVD